MGFFSDLFSSENDSISEAIPPIMPDGAIAQINSGILPIMNTDKIILTKGEECHFAERAILITEKVSKRYEGRTNGYSIKLSKHVTYRVGKNKGKSVEEITQEKTKGLVYVTNKRIIFLSDKNAFEKKYLALTACMPYSNAVKLQFGTKTFTLMLPDGGAFGNVITLIGNSKS